MMDSERNTREGFRVTVICFVGQWDECGLREALVECLGDENGVFSFLNKVRLS